MQVRAGCLSSSSAKQLRNTSTKGQKFTEIAFLVGAVSDFAQCHIGQHIQSWETKAARVRRGHGTDGRQRSALS